ncbi:MAG: FAD-dependent oxidoreductase [Treponemataceae bacterium]|nr:MAG: FAD-dependent oxidoreductase [Treponemataceae bacterium]
MKYVVLGASAAGINGIKAIRGLDKTGEITLVSEDSAVYSRCILHHYLSGERSEEALNFAEDDFASRCGVNWKRGVKAVSVDTSAKSVALSDGAGERYDKLLIAAGASTFFPPISGMFDGAALARGICGFRTLDDARAIKRAAQNASSVAVLGAGLIGVDAASGLLKYGKPVTLVESLPNMLAIQLDGTAAEAYQKKFAELGGTQHYGVKAEEITRGADGAVSGVRLSGGVHVPCDMLVCCTGVRANVKFLEGSGIPTDAKGLVFNDRGETGVQDVYGAGDVSGKSPIWPLAVKQGIVAGANMAGGDERLDSFFASKSAMSFWGIQTLSMGIHTAPDSSYVTETQKDDGGYKKIIHKDGKIYGAIVQGDISYAGVLTQLIAEKIDVSRVKKPLFKIDYSDFFTLKENFEFMY